MSPRPERRRGQRRGIRSAQRQAGKRPAEPHPAFVQQACRRRTHARLPARALQPGTFPVRDGPGNRLEALEVSAPARSGESAPGGAPHPVAGHGSKGVKLHFAVQACFKVRIVPQQGLCSRPVVGEVNETAARKIAVGAFGQGTGDRDPVYHRLDIGQVPLEVPPAQRPGIGDVTTKNKPGHDSVSEQCGNVPPTTGHNYRVGDNSHHGPFPANRWGGIITRGSRNGIGRRRNGCPPRQTGARRGR